MPASGKMAAATQPQTIQKGVLVKLIIFALLVAIAPISTYFITLNHLWNGQTAYAALSAVFAANIVLFGYVFLAFREEQADQKALQEKKQGKAE